jgi:hypothetical protein
MRILSLLAIFATPALGCSCVPGSTSACSGIGAGTVVFVGRATVDSGPGFGKGHARVAVEEALFNTPNGAPELDIDTGAGSSCYFRLKLGERYVIYAWKDTQTGHLSTGVCSRNFLVKGNEHLLDAVRNLSKGGPSRIVGTVQKSTGLYSHDEGVAGATVTAKSADNLLQTTADALGAYEFRGVPEGRYLLEVAKDGFVPDESYNHRWLGFLAKNEKTGVLEPDRREPGSVIVGKASCAVWDLSMWSNARIGGVVRNQAGEPLKGVVVQAFQFDNKGKQQSTSLRTAISDDEGHYHLERLPAADYLVGVNAEPYADRNPFPPTVYSKAGSPARVHVDDGRDVPNVDLTLGAPRTPAKLRVTVVGPDGKTVRNAAVRLDDLNGEQRAWARNDANPNDWIEVSVYVGERYIVNALESIRKGSARVDIGATQASVTIFLADGQ